jgi:crotonobetainyl-CoA:carnitine CoA-transferase CaiB-like acyl-CoA transferase
VTDVEHSLLGELWSAAGGETALLDCVRMTGTSNFASRYPVAELATASIAAAGLSVAEFAAADGSPLGEVAVDRGLSAAWFSSTLRPEGWDLPDPWDDLAGDYRCADGWIRLHTNDPSHRAAALSALGIPDSADQHSLRNRVISAVRPWTADELESAVVAAFGCAARLRSPADWAVHGQGAAVAAEPLLARSVTNSGNDRQPISPAERPLRGLQVLDLTRVLAGPAATRLLAGFGAEVLRIDPLDRDEPAVEAEMTLGKRCARLDLRANRGRLLELVADADVLIHGYRPGALDGLGFDQATRRNARPGLVEVALDAYGWTGPWRGRRGFDSLVQMSSGIAYPDSDEPDARPTPLPVQALDHATGYLVATAAVRGLTERRRSGRGSAATASLARMAALLQQCEPTAEVPTRNPVEPGQRLTRYREFPETTGWGRAWRLEPPVRVGPAVLRWDRPAAPLGSSEAAWPSHARTS